MNTVHEPMPTSRKPIHHRFWLWLGVGVLVLGAAFLVTLQILIDRATPIARKRLIQTLSAQLDSRVELDQLHVSVARGLAVTGGGLRIFPNNQAIESDTHEPLIAVASFEFHANLPGLLLKPMHVGAVHVQGLAINIPPKHGQNNSASGQRKFSKPKFVIDEVICDDSHLTIETNKPDKSPLVFELKHIVMHGVGRDAPWPYEATLTNAIPPGEIQASGTFGPWNVESPGDSNVTGKYFFDHADLNSIRGIGGTLHSRGEYSGQIDRIEAHGHVEVPNFSLDTANRPVPLETEYSATIDGMNGDTYLNKVDAKLADTSFTCSGAIVSEKGKGHHINIDADVPAGRIQDFLNLAVKTSPPVMSGVIRMKTSVDILPGHNTPILQRLSMKGNFTLQQIHFTNPEIEDKVDMMSLRAQGKPKEAKPGAPDVHSEMTGNFEMKDGKMTLPDLRYELPGASIQLAGVYTLDGKQFEFTGKVRTSAELSQMVASKWKSILLKPVDPFFRKNGAGAEIPIKVSGTGDKPHVGLKFGGDK